MSTQEHNALGDSMTTATEDRMRELLKLRMGEGWRTALDSRRLTLGKVEREPSGDGDMCDVLLAGKVVVGHCTKADGEAPQYRQWMVELNAEKWALPDMLQGMTIDGSSTKAETLHDIREAVDAKLMRHHRNLPRYWSNNPKLSR